LGRGGEAVILAFGKMTGEVYTGNSSIFNGIRIELFNKIIRNKNRINGTDFLH
jgi:hypothetical protein